MVVKIRIIHMSSIVGSYRRYWPKKDIIRYNYVWWSLEFPTGRKTFESELFKIENYKWYWTHSAIVLSFFLYFFCSGLRDRIACSLLGGNITYQNSGYTVTRLWLNALFLYVVSQRSAGMAHHAQGSTLAPIHSAPLEPLTPLDVILSPPPPLSAPPLPLPLPPNPRS